MQKHYQQDEGDFFKIVFHLTNSPKPPNYSVYYHLRQRKAANPHNLEAGTQECLVFLS